MVSPLLIGSSINVGLLVILCIGFTFTYMIEKFPNFGHISYASIGTVISYYMTKLVGINPYYAWPISTIICGLLGIVLYLIIVRPIKILGTRIIALTFVFFAISQVINTFVAMFSYWVLMTNKYRTGGFLLRYYDFEWYGVPGVAITAPLTCVVLVVVLHFFLTRNRFGIAIRATAEDERLAASLGINTFKVHLVSWFISGGLAGLAGAITPLWMGTGIGPNDEFLVSVMTGSVLGGLSSINGAIIGGLFVALGQQIISLAMMQLFGPWAGGYYGLWPIIFLFIILMIEPEGITSILGRPHNPIMTLRRFYKLLKYRIYEIFQGV